MVRKVICAIGLLVAICGAMATQAMAYSVYDGTPSATYITYFRDMLAKFSVTQDYVVFRSSQYEYMMVLGDLHISDNRIQSPAAVDICAISTNNGYNASYSISFRTEPQFELELGDEIVYSNLGSYPSLEERSDVVDFATLFLAACAAFCCLLRGIIDWRQSFGR